MACLLVVDDNDCDREIIAEFLRDQAHELIFARDGQEAWELLHATPERFDAAILDRVMPRLDGLELLRRIRADRRFDAMPTIMQTAANTPGEVAEGLSAGAYYYLAKPYDALVLGSVVRGALYDRGRRLELTRLASEMRRFLNLMRAATFRFRTLEEAQLLAASFAQVGPRGGALSLGLSELLLNAVEHGNLGIGYQEKSRLIEAGTWHEEVTRRLASPEQAGRWASLEFTREDASVCFIVRDQGPGFDWRRYLRLDPERAFDSHGRGIALAGQIAFDTLDYLENGCVARAWARLDEDEGDTSAPPA